MIVKFMCGCETKEIIARENVKTMDMVTFDSDGFLICAVHHCRRYGWRSIPTLPGLKLADWRFKAWTPLEIEAFLVFDQPFPLRAREINPPTGVDRRDNRAPESLVVRVAALDAGDAGVVTSTDEAPLYIVPREPRSARQRLLDELAEIGQSSSRSQVLPWPEHIRDYDGHLQRRLRAVPSTRFAADQA
jgi:hypothetical protein